MPSRLVRALTHYARRVGQTVKNLLRPVRTASLLAGAACVDTVRPRSVLLAENALLRQQVLVLRRAAAGRRPRVHLEDRLFLVLLARLNSAWRDALLVVKPETLLRWHRDLFALVWRRRSRQKSGRKPLRPEVIELIRTMATANGLWGAKRIRGELLKLGIHASKRTIQKYMRSVRPRRPSGQTWSTFLRNHAHEIWDCDFLQLSDAWFRPLYAFVIVVQASREVRHANVTRTPTDAWVAQQLREATPYEQAPRFLIRDNGGKFGSLFDAAADGAGIEVVAIPPRSPNLNAVCERFLGGLRRECLDYVLILNEAHLRQVLAEWVEHFNGGRPHQGLRQRIPSETGRRFDNETSLTGHIVALPVLGGLHHDYRRVA